MPDILHAYRKIQVLAVRLTNPSHFEFPPPSNVAKMEKKTHMKEKLANILLANFFPPFKKILAFTTFLDSENA